MIALALLPSAKCRGCNAKSPKPLTALLKRNADMLKQSAIDTAANPSSVIDIETLQRYSKTELKPSKTNPEINAKDAVASNRRTETPA